MKGTLIHGKPIADRILKEAKARAKKLKKQGLLPHLGVVLVGDDAPSKTYVGEKAKAAKAIGIDFTLLHFSEKITTKELVEKIEDIQSTGMLTGLIVQLPLPRHIDRHTVVSAIDPTIDVDCLTDTNLGRLFSDDGGFVPPTPGAVLAILEKMKVKELRGKNVTVIGMGPLVGKPLAALMIQKGASVTTCNTSTRDIQTKCLSADIIVTGVGKKHMLTADFVMPGTIVVDTGVSFENKKGYGDVDVVSVIKKGASTTPTPGGVGPITVAKLLANTVLSADRMGTTDRGHR